MASHARLTPLTPQGDGAPWLWRVSGLVCQAGASRFGLKRGQAVWGGGGLWCAANAPTCWFSSGVFLRLGVPAVINAS